MISEKSLSLNLQLRQAKPQDFFLIDKATDRKVYQVGLPYLVDINDGKFRIEKFGLSKGQVSYFKAMFAEGRVYVVENTDGVGGICG